MKNIPRILPALSAVCLLSSSAQGQWTSVGVGVEYQKFTTADPNNIFVSRMAVSNPNAIIGSTIALNRIAGANETTSAQFSRYDDALNCWGQAWGQRNDVVVAINGSFSSGGIITGGHIQDGWYAKRFDDWSGQTGFVWKQDRSYFIGVCPHYQAGDQTVVINGTSRTFEGINVARGANQLILYTPQYNNNTLTDNSGVEVLVELSTPLLVPPGATTGTIKEVRIGQGSTSLPFDHLVLSGVGTAATFLQSNAQVGRQVTISQDLALFDGPLGDLCSVPDSRNFNNAYSLVQGNWVFLKNGVTLSSTDAGMTKKNPRTAVAYNSTYVFFVVCDGRSAQSVGWTSDEMAAFCKNTLGATDGVNLDGGGSSAMVVNGVLKNTPSDGAERPIPNGLIMANLLPKTLSSTFASGQSVRTLTTANVRLGPGTDYYAFATVSGGAQGTVTAHTLNGVYARGYYWWQCTFSGATGWIAESLLATPTNPPSISQHPANQLVNAGGAASFTILASGASPLGYQWQKNTAHLSNGGHYSGCTTATLTVTNVDSNDAASYRCVVTNAYGSVTSIAATLTLTPLVSIPTLSGDSANEARAITPDGRWATGLSGSRGFLYDLNSSSPVNVVSSDGAQSALVTGIGYRTNSGQQQLVLSGMAGGWFTAWMTTNGGATWGAKIQEASGAKPTVPLANGLAGASSDAFYSVWTDEGNGGSDNWTLNVGRFSNAWPASVAWGSKGVTKPDTTQMNGISSNGRAVGWRRNGTTLLYTNYVADWRGAITPAIWNCNGLLGTAGQAYSVSADGTIIFGLSPKAGASAATNYGYKAVFNAAFPGPATLLSVAELPNFPDTAGSANLAIPYGCTADGKYAAGMNYRGMEKAVLWDTHDASSTNWTVTDLTDLAVAGGNLNIFSRLTRAYSIATNGAGNLVIAGVGLDSDSPAKTRAFLMTLALSNVPRPTLTISGSYPAGFTFSFPTVVTSLRYYLDYTTNFTGTLTWSTLASTPGTGAIAILQDANPSGAQRFYRLRVQ